jgi:hexosaminidase
MKWCLLVIVISTFLPIIICVDQDTETYVSPFPKPSSSSQGEVWPLPQKIEYHRENRTIRKGSISIVFQGLRDVDCDILEFAKRTYQRDWFFPNRFSNHNSQTNLRLVIRTDSKCPEKDEYPQQGMNEEYFLQVPSGGDAILEAEEVWGVLRGLETFSQLIFQQNGQVIIIY